MRQVVNWNGRTYICDVCSAMVMVKDQHAKWHEGMNVILTSYVETKIGRKVTDEDLADDEDEIEEKD